MPHPTPTLTAPEQTELLRNLSQQAAAYLIGLTPRTLRDSDAPRGPSGTYDAAELVRWAKRRADGEPAISGPDWELTRQLAALVAEGLPVGAVAALHDLATDLRERYGTAGGDWLASVLLGELVPHVKDDRPALFAPTAEEQAADAASRRQQAARARARAAGRLALVCGDCGRLRQGANWVKARPAAGAVVEHVICEICERKEKR